MKNSPLAKLAGDRPAPQPRQGRRCGEESDRGVEADAQGQDHRRAGLDHELAFLEKYFKDVVTIREYKTTEQHDLDLAAGRIDGIFAAHSSLKATLDKPDFKDMAIAGAGVSGGVLGRGVAVGMRKDDAELKALFDAAIAAAIADGTIEKLTQKWFKIDMTPQA